MHQVTIQPTGETYIEYKVAYVQEVDFCRILVDGEIVIKFIGAEDLDITSDALEPLWEALDVEVHSDS